MDQFNILSNIEFPKSLCHLPTGSHNIKDLGWHVNKKWGAKVMITLDDDSEYLLTPRASKFFKENNDIFIAYKNLANNGRLQLDFFGGKLSNFIFIELK